MKNFLVVQFAKSFWSHYGRPEGRGSILNFDANHRMPEGRGSVVQQLFRSLK